MTTRGVTVISKRKPGEKEVPFPEYLTREKPPYNPRVMRVAVDRYFRQEYHDLEVEKIWKKAWQWVCREEEIPEIGDHMIYEVANLSFIVIRTGEKAFKSYWNSCLHRGRKLRDSGGKRAVEFRCNFHGWTWNVDGTLKEMSCGWDFPGTREEVTRLPEAKTGTWGGFVFINPDPNAETLEDFLGELPDHFEGSGHDFAKRWKQVHVVADLPVNWKVAQEAFIEPWHVIATHPQILGTKDAPLMSSHRWDDFGNWMRSAPALPTDQYKSPPGWSVAAETDQDVIDQHWDFHLNEESPVKAEEGVNPYEIINGKIREFYEPIIGEEMEDFHDVHLGGGEMVHVFPNFHPWGGLSRLVYRFRPYKNNPERCLMDVILLAPWPKDVPMPPPAPIHFLGPDEPISNAVELGMLARIFSQDIGNMPKVQEGLKTSAQGYIILSQHNEAPVRHLHDLYNKWMGFEDGDYLAERRGK
jgi:phenylpropionate dioxygenase-like ring-hydroxylating dioxygenase large terminal subunit